MMGIFYAILIFWIPSSLVNSIQDVAFFQVTSNEISSKEFISVYKQCDGDAVKKWTIDFHDCFLKKKYDDGGKDLEYIVDRILRHAEACVETSDKGCRPNFGGFKTILNKTLEQMKDYSNMYLQEIRSGRDKIKDLKCVDDTLSLQVYEKCFSDFPASQNDYEIQSAVNKGIKCTNRENIECSKGARTSMNRIVRTIFRIEPPPEEGEMEEKAEPPPPKMWYDYVAEPFVSAWLAVKNFFSGMFG